MDVYRERAHLVAALAWLCPSVIAYSDPAEPEWPVVYVAAPTGQLSWHLSPADLDLFRHVPVVDASDPRAQWDGHTTEQKYERLAAIIPQDGGVGIWRHQCGRLNEGEYHNGAFCQGCRTNVTHPEDVEGRYLLVKVGD